ncbi:hypothetical protein GWI33_005412 [Rhynchophorus ferrugineus]|uniref:Uncharacterized protein n=1 Tax=Rhynchophorus ferrugineus TaxID=354439 RepID=A0A834IGQ4_RHYFE|nr:hypothetical protein GWI33_005412 [Rhynchophorus ferrugineus]
MLLVVKRVLIQMVPIEQTLEFLICDALVAVFLLVTRRDENKPDQTHQKKTHTGQKMTWWYADDVDDEGRLIRVERCAYGTFFIREIPVPVLGRALLWSTTHVNHNRPLINLTDDQSKPWFQ